MVAATPGVVKDGAEVFRGQDRAPGSLAAGVPRLTEDPARRLAQGARSRQRFEQEFAWDPLARRYLSHFERLRGNTARRLLSQV